MSTGNRLMLAREVSERVRDIIERALDECGVPAEQRTQAIWEACDLLNRMCGGQGLTPLEEG